jgi:hypothetical protein
VLRAPADARSFWYQNRLKSASDIIHATIRA